MRYSIIVFALLLHGSTVLGAQLNLPRDVNGWTILTPSADSRIIYVDPVSGNNTTCESYLPSNSLIGEDPFNPAGAIVPCQTIAVATSKLTGNMPDWLLIKRGTTVPEKIYGSHKNGRNATEPFVMGAYGTGAMPVIDYYEASSYHIYFNGTNQWKFFTGLDFYSSARNPADANFSTNSNYYGINFNASAGSTQQGITFEGCKFRFFTGNIGQKAATAAASGITFRRNIFVDHYSGTSSTGEAIYLSGVDNVIIEENIFDHNGWLVIGDADADGLPVGGATFRNQTLYMSYCPNIQIKNNVISRSSHAAIKIDSDELPATQNHLVHNNLILDSAIGVGANDGDTNFDYRLYNLTITDNVFSHMGLSDTTGQGIAWALYTRDLDVSTIRNNLMISQNSDAIDNVTFFEMWGGSRGVVFSDNIAYGNKNIKGLYLRAGGAKDVTISKNIIDILSSTGRIVVAGDAAPNAIDSALSGYILQNNKYYSVSPSGERYTLNGNDIPDTTWFSNTGDDSTFEQHSFPDPTRSVETYMASLGEIATIDAFIAKARAQGRYSWDTHYTADAVNDYIRAGFGMGQRRFFRNVRVGEVEL